MPQLRRLALVPVALFACACAGPRESLSSGVTSVATAVGAGPKAAEPKDFVRGSRPERTEYQPVGRTPPPRAVPTPTALQVQTTEAALEARRAANQAAGSAGAAAGEAAKSNAPKPAAR